MDKFYDMMLNKFNFDSKNDKFPLIEYLNSKILKNNNFIKIRSSGLSVEKSLSNFNECLQINNSYNKRSLLSQKSDKKKFFKKLRNYEMKEINTMKPSLFYMELKKDKKNLYTFDNTKRNLKLMIPCRDNKKKIKFNLNKNFMNEINKEDNKKYILVSKKYKDRLPSLLETKSMKEKSQNKRNKTLSICIEKSINNDLKSLKSNKESNLSSFEKINFKNFQNSFLKENSSLNSTMENLEKKFKEEIKNNIKAKIELSDKPIDNKFEDEKENFTRLLFNNEIKFPKKQIKLNSFLNKFFLKKN